MATLESQLRPSDAGFRARVVNFFMAEEVPFGMALSRISLSLVLLVVMASRWRHARELFSSDGATAQLWVLYGRLPTLPELPGSAVVVLLSLTVFFLAASMVGWQTRFSVAASFVLYTYFNMLDGISSMTKYSVIASHGMLLLAVSPCGAVWSVDAWLERRRRTQWPGDFDADAPRHPMWSRRLLALMIGLCYFGAALTKMHTPGFFSGDQLSYWMITQVNQYNPVGEWMTLVPWVLVVFAYVSIVWEVLFVFLAWRGVGRLSMLGLGFAFHFGTLLLLGLYVFPLVCWTTYFAFMDEADARRMTAWFRRQKRRFFGVRKSPVVVAAAEPAVPRGFRLPVSSFGAFASALVLVSVVGLWGEHLLDPYGLRRPEGPYELQPLDPEVARTYLGPSPKMRAEDMVYTFDAGTDMLGGVLMGRKQQFRQGEAMILQVTFAPPHEDMWVECNLHDSEGRLLEEVGQAISRDKLRTNFVYLLGDGFDPGEYEFVLKAAGRPVSRRKIELLPKSGEPSPTKTAELAN